jgi:membrane protease YdiL (CAAX protease family)
MGIGLIMISLVMLFLLGAGFAWLFIRSGNILLVGLIHGVMDYPLIGKDSQLSFIILIAAIGLVELVSFINRKKAVLAV